MLTSTFPGSDADHPHVSAPKRNEARFHAVTRAEPAAPTPNVRLQRTA